MADGWWPDPARLTGTKYQAIAASIGDAIARRELRGGDRLPPQRALAERLGVDLTTVTRAYEQVRRQGLIEARGRAGSFVAQTSEPVMPVADSTDSAMNAPPGLPDGMLAQAIRVTMAALLDQGAAGRLQYQAAGGAPEDRRAGARLLSGSGLATDEEQLIITAGGQNALHAIVGATLVPGDTIACGRFVYPGLRMLAARFGLRLLPLDTLDAATLERACRAEAVRALYVVPTNDNPTAVTLSGAAREAIADVASRYDLQIIEDDAYGGLAEAPPPPIAACAPDRTWYIASMSKILTPALRVAFVRAPGVGDALRLSADVHETAIMAPPLNTGLVCAWLADGSFERLTVAMRAEAAERQALARSILADVPHLGHPQGYHLWLPLPDGIAASELANAMRPTGLSVVPGERFAVEPGPAHAVRVSLGGAIGREQLGRALRILHGHVAAPVARVLPLV